MARSQDEDEMGIGLSQVLEELNKDLLLPLMGRTRNEDGLVSLKAKGSGQSDRCFPGERWKELIKFYVAHHLRPFRWSADLNDPAPILPCLHQKEGDIFHTSFKERF